ncbi:MAG TPA: hypothetical protein VMJ14_06530 [Burkholderiales bacterium]|nr:hypothetical protein [Burkholderiales bacterium]
MLLRLAAPAFLLCLFGCAAPAPTEPAAAAPQKITIYESVTGAPARFQIVKRLWIESWISVVGSPWYDSLDEAKQAFREHAESLGGNGVINFGCYRMAGVLGGSPRLSCNGTIVRFL